MTGITMTVQTPPLNMSGKSVFIWWKKMKNWVTPVISQHAAVNQPAEIVGPDKIYFSFETPASGYCNSIISDKLDAAHLRQVDHVSDRKLSAKFKDDVYREYTAWWAYPWRYVLLPKKNHRPSSKATHGISRGGLIWRNYGGLISSIVQIQLFPQ